MVIRGDPMGLAFKGYPTPIRSGGRSGGAIGTGPGQGGATSIPTNWTPPKPSNDNPMRTPGRSGIPTIRPIRGLKGGRLPIEQIARLYTWFQKTPGRRTVDDYNLAGWTLQCGSGTGPYSAQVGGCPLALTLVRDIYWDKGASYNPGTRTYTINFYADKGPPINVGTNAWSHWGNRVAVWTYTHPVAPPVHIPFSIPDPIRPATPYAVPGPPIPWMPNLQPEAIPIMQPTPEPAPVPVKWVPRLPGNAPNGDPIRGPRPRPRTPTDPGRKENPGPTIRWDYRWGRGTNQRTPTIEQPQTVRPEPPKKGVKETKKVLVVGGTIGRVFGNATEVGDFIEAVYEAIPKEKRSKKPAKYIGWDDKARAIRDQWEHIDWNVAFDNLVINELSDRLVGGLAKGVKRLNAKTGRPVGLMTGTAL